MTAVLSAGKLPVELLRRLIGAGGPLPREVLVGPAIGEDACAIDLPAGVLVVATDPVTLARRGAGRYAVTVNANDVASMGVRPRWFLMTVLLPEGSTDADAESLFSDVRESLQRIGAALVGGHTEISSAVTRPVVVGQMLGVAGEGSVVTTGGARPGDVLVQVGLAPLEGAAILAAEAAARLDGLDPDVVRAAAAALDEPGISVVESALLAAELGATSLHDPTEGGLAAALHELAAAAGVRLRVRRERLLWFGPAIAVCDAVGADPWATLASGALLATFGPGVGPAAVETLNARGHRAAVIGSVEVGAGVDDDRGRAILWPARDELNRLLDG
ncbi:MAG TPA: AIR synthase related protein [Acidimicrobiales bacterium]|nr:AIR synthase related protein [Acidimicrobiales bacterium]